jgi:hypothetical protein
VELQYFNYPTATKQPWEFSHRGKLLESFREENPLISKSAGIGEDNQHFFIRDKDHPYIQEKPFDWMEPTSFLQECFYYRRRMHDKHRKSKSVDTLHGVNSPSRQSCGIRIKETEPLVAKCSAI